MTANRYGRDRIQLDLYNTPFETVKDGDSQLYFTPNELELGAGCEVACSVAGLGGRMNKPVSPLVLQHMWYYRRNLNNGLISMYTNVHGYRIIISLTGHLVIRASDYAIVQYTRRIGSWCRH